MKVQGPSSTQAALNARRAGGAVAPGFVLPSGGFATSNAATQTAPTASLTNLGALLALQTEDDISERRRRATKRSNTLLDQLDGIRISILGNGVSREQVAALSNTLREYRDQVDDPGLEAILDDVELRAEVELAKLERAL
jgi:1-aminocyclopropane-1-carboxylate deaminase/D-cysteine desulfhydrase-like pyridoxal-dependent ACC family enzyme